MFKTITATTLLAAGASCAYPAINEIANPPAIEIKVVEKSWKCPGCNDNEKYVLEQLQKNTKIRDRNALAAIMGNIKSCLLYTSPSPRD